MTLRKDEGYFFDRERGVKPLSYALKKQYESKNRLVL